MILTTIAKPGMTFTGPSNGPFLCFRSSNRSNHSAVRVSKRTVFGTCKSHSGLGYKHNIASTSCYLCIFCMKRVGYYGF